MKGEFLVGLLIAQLAGRDANRLKEIRSRFSGFATIDLANISFKDFGDGEVVAIWAEAQCSSPADYILGLDLKCDIFVLILINLVANKQLSNCRAFIFKFLLHSVL